MGAGDMIVVFDGEAEYRARIADADRSGMWCDIVNMNEVNDRATARQAAPLRLTLAPALIKARRMDMIVEKATELGVYCIAPFVSARCVVKPTAARISHLRKIAESASAQSGRIRVPEIKDPVTFDEIVKIKADIRVILLEGAKGQNIDEILASHSKRMGEPMCSPDESATAILLVGPEGGFTEEEALSANEHGFLTWNLGPAVLRAETAAIAGLAILLNALESGLDL